MTKRIGRVDRLPLMVWGSLATTPPRMALSLLMEGPLTDRLLADCSRRETRRRR